MERAALPTHTLLLGVTAVLLLSSTLDATGDHPDIRSHTECLYTHFGTAYMGSVSRTKSGKACQRWSSQTPHSHSHTSETEYPDSSVSEAANYCRNPSGVRDLGVWCYTTDPSTEWEYCEVPYCECKIYRSGHGYLGTHSATYTDVTCQRWDAQAPHAHSYEDEDFLDHTISDANNYCRNPDPNWHWGTFCLTIKPNIRSQHCSLPFCECKTTEEGELYEGYQNTTNSGKACQAWSEQTPHEHSYADISMFPDTRMAAAASHCRNPDSSAAGGPWCFTTDPNTRWEYCDLPKCEYMEPVAATTTTTTRAPSTTPYTGPTPTVRAEEEVQAAVIQECKFSRRGSSYRGVVSVTVTGKMCQTWTDQSPHEHPIISDDRVADATLVDASNHCRNPNFAPLGPWCYTNSPNTRMEYCDIPLCECKSSRSGSGYAGLKHKTRSGVECQRWDTQTPHRHNFGDDAFPDGSTRAAENYCRNPNNHDPNGPWCLSTDPDIRWEYCGLPYCECKQDVPGLNYAGQIAVTVSGKRCQRWDSQTPHSHSYNQGSMFPEGQTQSAKNYCRNPDDDEPQGPWCYTTDPDTRWEYCDVPLCELEPPPAGSEMESHPEVPKTGPSTTTSKNSTGMQDCKLSKTGETYRGSISHTVTYRACQRWDQQLPHPHQYTNPGSFPDTSLEEAGDACRNPTRSRPDGPWCFTLDPTVEWEYCPVAECGCKKNKGGWTFNGTMSVTINGYTCQRWDSQAPHNHRYSQVKLFPDEALADAANYCRNPDMWEPDGPWCLTTDPNKEWDYCDIPFCECTTTKAGHEYGGRVNKTRSGLTCQRWDSQSPHPHRYYSPCLFPETALEDAENFCRNPEQNEMKGVWCYTTSTGKQWGYCDLPMCEDNGKHPLITMHGDLTTGTTAMLQSPQSSPGVSSGPMAAIIILSILVVILILIIIVIVVIYPRRHQLTICLARAKDVVTTKAFDNPLYGTTGGLASPGAAYSTSGVRLDVPDPMATEQPPKEEVDGLPKKHSIKE